MVVHQSNKDNKWYLLNEKVWFFSIFHKKTSKLSFKKHNKYFGILKELIGLLYWSVAEFEPTKFDDINLL